MCGEEKEWKLIICGIRIVTAYQDRHHHLKLSTKISPEVCVKNNLVLFSIGLYLYFVRYCRGGKASQLKEAATQVN